MPKEIYNYFMWFDPLNYKTKKTHCEYSFLNVNRIVWQMKEGCIRKLEVSTVFEKGSIPLQIY